MAMTISPTVKGSGSATMNGRLSSRSVARTLLTASTRLSSESSERRAFSAAKRQRIGRARQLGEAPHVALHALAIDQHQPERDPIEAGLGEPLLGGELGAAISVGRRRRSRLGEHALRGAAGLGSDRGQEHEALHACALGGAGELHRGFGVEQAVVVLGEAGHGLGDAGGMDHGIDADKRLRHVVGLGEVADQGAGAVELDLTRPPQQHAQAIAPLRQLLEQVLPDEAGGTGQRDQGLMGRRGSRGPTLLGCWRT